MLRRLADEDGQGLGGHRLVFEASALGRAGRSSDPVPKVFELVSGARVEGRAVPGEPVSAELELRTNRGRRIVYRTRTLADPKGQYTLRLPYANNDAGRGSTETGPHYRVRSRGIEGRVQVDERQVTEGATAAGPNLGS